MFSHLSYCFNAPTKRKSHNIYLFSVYFPMKKNDFKTGKNKVKNKDTLMRVIDE